MALNRHIQQAIYQQAIDGVRIGIDKLKGDALIFAATALGFEINTDDVIVNMAAIEEQLVLMVLLTDYFLKN